MRPTLPNTRILTLPGIVVAAHDKNDDILNKRVLFVSARGWEMYPLAADAPKGSVSPNHTITNSHQRFGLLGGGDNPLIGTFSAHCIVSHEKVILTPAHLDDYERGVAEQQTCLFLPSLFKLRAGGPGDKRFLFVLQQQIALGVSRVPIGLRIFELRARGVHCGSYLY